MRWRCWTVGGWISEPHVLSSDLSPSLSHQVLLLPSLCLGGTCCQWDQSGVFAGLYLVWTFLTSLSPPPTRVGAKEPPPPCSAPPGPRNDMVTVTLACVNMPLSSESRACEEGTEQRDRAKPGQDNRAGLSARQGLAPLFGHVPLCPQPRCCRK